MNASGMLLTNAAASLALFGGIEMAIFPRFLGTLAARCKDANTMRIEAITASDEGRHFSITLPKVKSSLTTIYGPAGSGKSAVADLIGHAVFGKHRVAASGSLAANGELVVEGHGGRYRIRASHDPGGRTRLTVAALGESPIDHHTIRRLVGNLSPVVLTPLCAVSFREPPNAARLLSPEFVAGFGRIAGEEGTLDNRRVSELAARRDLLAQELETRISTERHASKELEVRWSELDRLIRDEQQVAAAAEQRLKAVENSLAETDARLRYRRIELNVELRLAVERSARCGAAGGPRRPNLTLPADVDRTRRAGIASQGAPGASANRRSKISGRGCG